MSVNFQNMVADFSKMEAKANEDGLIPIFNILSVQLPTNFYNLFSLKLLQSIIDNPQNLQLSESMIETLHNYAGSLLENAAAECGYNVGCGTINSKEFNDLMSPIIKTPDDILYGLFAVAASFGWGDLEIVELTKEKLVLRIYDYYEADVKGKIQNYFAYLWMGVARSFMDIVYGAKCPPHMLGEFKCEQTKGIELGDEYGEFIVTKKS